MYVVLLKVHVEYLNVHFRFPSTHALISTSHGRSMNPRGALYAFTNCPCSISCHRGVMQVALTGCCVCAVPDLLIIGLLPVPRLSIGFVVSSIFPCVVNSAPLFSGGVGWMYSLRKF